MERSFTQREWHHIQLRDVAVPAAVADRAFYAAFYRRLLAGTEAIDPLWLEQKRRLGRWIVGEFLSTAREGARVLSIGAGLGVVEGEIATHGVGVDILECEPASLRFAVTHYSQLRPLVGDARALPLQSGAYDLVCVAGVDYAFPRSEYVDVLREARRVLRVGGRAVVICLSNLSLPEMLRTLRPRRAAAMSGDTVPWSYQRSVGEHIGAARRAGLLTERVYQLNARCEPESSRSGRSWFARAPTWTGVPVAVSFTQS